MTILTQVSNRLNGGFLRPFLLVPFGVSGASGALFVMLTCKSVRNGVSTWEEGCHPSTPLRLDGGLFCELLGRAFASVVPADLPMCFSGVKTRGLLHVIDRRLGE